MTNYKNVNAIISCSNFTKISVMIILLFNSLMYIKAFNFTVAIFLHIVHILSQKVIFGGNSRDKQTMISKIF